MRVATELGFLEAVDATNGGSITAREIADSRKVDQLLVGATVAPLRRGMFADYMQSVSCAS